MVYVTGDIHGDPRDLIHFSEVYSLTSKDTIIILGDAGFNFYLHGRDCKAKKLATRIPATLLCIHGQSRGAYISYPPTSKVSPILFPKSGTCINPLFSLRAKR